MKIRLFLVFTLTLCCDILLAQTRVRIRVLDENDQPLKFIRLTLSGTSLPIETQSNGEYTLEFPPGKAEIVFYPPSGYERISPPNGALIMPEDKSRTIDIWLARKGADNREVETFARVLSKKEEEKARLKIENEELKGRLVKLETDHQVTSALRDSIATAVKNNTSNEAALSKEIADLKEAVGLKRQLYYKKISGELVVYTDRLKDLRDALPRVRDAFIDNRSMTRLDKIIAAYNVARDSVLQNHRGHTEIVRALWGAPAAEALAKVYEQALATVHQQSVLPLNTNLLDQFRAVRAEEIRPAKARKKVEKTAKETLEKLNNQIPTFESDIRAVLSQLEAAIH
jgi:hypothetical protein